jgi:ADP-heptose:LPS heptosyltransferase
MGYPSGSIHLERNCRMAFDVANLEAAEQPIRVLVRRTSGLGDVILVTGIVRKLHEQFRGRSVLDVMTAHPSVFENNPYVRKCLTPNHPINLQNYDKIINLDDAYERNRYLHIIASYALIAFGNADELPVPELFPDPSADERIKNIRRSIGGRYIVVHARASHQFLARNLSSIFWSEMIKALQKNSDKEIVVIGGGADLRFSGARIHGFHDALSLHDIYGVIDGADAFVGVDSGLFHIATCTATPVIGLFTQALSELRGPVGRSGHFVPISASVDCVGCIHDPQMTPAMAALGCLRHDFVCTRSFSAEQVAGCVLSFCEFEDGESPMRKLA